MNRINYALQIKQAYNWSMTPKRGQFHSYLVLFPKM